MAAVFLANGFSFASWASRLPAVRDDLGLSSAELGFVLLGLSAGAVTALPLSGAIVHRIGAGRTVLGFGLLNALALVAVGWSGAVPVLVVSLFLLGAGTGLWDVAMNVEGAVVERRIQRPIMPRFHGGWSIGSVVGAGIGSLAAAADVGVGAHLGTVAAAVAVAVVTATRSFASVPDSGPGQRVRSGPLGAWTERRTLGLGLLVFGMAFAEGVANDWLAIGLVDGYGASHATAAAGFGVFVAAMTGGRLIGPLVLQRLGRVHTLRGSALLVLLGVGLVVSGGWDGAGRQAWAPAAAVLGAWIWGLGAALGFPVGMSAAADEPARAAARVSVVATVGYTAFLAGPPLLGLLGEQLGVIRALSVVVLAVLMTLLTAPAARPPAPVAGV